MSPLTTLDSEGWELDDAERLNASHPTTFSIPNLAERASLEPGQLAKLVFLFLTQDDNGDIINGERMWVKVARRQGSGYLGVLESEPVTSDSVRCGDEIYFEPRHVATTLIRYNDPRHPDYAPTAFGRFFKRVRNLLRRHRAKRALPPSSQ